MQAAFAEREFELPPRGPGCSLQAYADRLSSYYAIRARQAVLVGAEVQEWAAFDEYALAQLQADALRTARTARNATLKQERQRARQWEGYFRTVYCGVFAYTETLRNTTNPDTKELWKRDERTAEAQRLYPRAALSLAAGFVEDEALDTIGHAASRKSEADYAWKPPEVGFIKVRAT